MYFGPWGRLGTGLTDIVLTEMVANAWDAGASGARVSGHHMDRSVDRRRAR